MHMRGALLRAANLCLAAAQPHGLASLRAGVSPTELLTYRQVSSFFQLSVKTVLYIGANRGQELPLLRAAFPEAEIHCFEPLGEVFSELSRACEARAGCAAYNLAVSDTTGTAEIRRSRDHDEASSLRAPNDAMEALYPHVGDWTSEVVETVTLDEWAVDRDLADDLVIKLDTQGSEDLVIRGGPEMVKKARAVIVELAVRPTYREAPTGSKIEALLASIGYVYAGQLSAVRSPVTNEVVEYDAAFVRVLER